MSQLATMSADFIGVGRQAVSYYHTTDKPRCNHVLLLLRRSFVIPIARAAGTLKRADPDASEEVILYRTMLDLIKPKLVFLDLPLFMALLSDLFPGVELPASDGGVLRAAIEQELREAGLQVSMSDWVG